VPWFDERLIINQLTLDAHDPISKQPDYKKCAVRIVPRRAAAMSSARLFHVIAAGAVAVALMGLATSWRSVPTARRYARPEPPTSAAPLAPPTPERERHHDNRLRHPGNLRAMGAPARDRRPVARGLRRAMVRRARRPPQRRAYDGAPPTIPHPIRQQDFPNCMTCHGEGLRVGAQVAPAICHETHVSCVQCHVVSVDPIPGAPPDGGSPSRTTASPGSRPPLRGERAWVGAPPTIPHPTNMRSNCGSCHGPLALGLRTSHPWRQSCTQCHAPSAALDQRPTYAGTPPPLALR
jgi:cytochrome c-type protein NapB